MHEVAVRVAPSGWREWLLRLADTRGLRRVEVAGDLVWAERDALLRMARHLGLALLHITDVVPANLSCYLGEEPWADDEALLAGLVRDVRRQMPQSVRFASLDLGLDRLAAPGFDRGLQRRVAFARRLAQALAPLDTRLAVRVRMPRPFEGSRQWEWAGNLLHELREERCCLAMDVVLRELPGSFDVEALLRDCAPRLGVVRLHFGWRQGEALEPACRDAWTGVLRRQPDSLAVVLCPSGPTPASAPSLLADMERWAGRL